MYKIVSRVVKQDNPFYNPRFSNNGGGYDQPFSYWLIVDQNSKEKFYAIKEDSSCGDFGTRIYQAVKKEDGTVIYEASINTMDVNYWPSDDGPDTNDWEDWNWERYNPVNPTDRNAILFAEFFNFGRISNNYT